MQFSFLLFLRQQMQGMQGPPTTMQATQQSSQMFPAQQQQMYPNMQQQGKFTFFINLFYNV